MSKKAVIGVGLALVGVMLYKKWAAAKAEAADSGLTTAETVVVAPSEPTVMPTAGATRAPILRVPIRKLPGGNVRPPAIAVMPRLAKNPLL